VRLKAARTQSCWSKSSSPFIASSEAGGRFDLEVIDRRPGRVVVRVRGKGARALFEGEIGGHRWQRIPATEKRGRVHSSTITIAVLDEAVEAEIALPESELEWSACRSPGAGGQNVQKTDSAVRVKHLPTGIAVRAHESRSYHANRATALERLRDQLAALRRDAAGAARAAERRAQVGSGMRGDKRRTVRVQDDSVVDHLTGRTWRYKQYARGDW